MDAMAGPLRRRRPDHRARDFRWQLTDVPRFPSSLPLARRRFGQKPGCTGLLYAPRCGAV
jgi:hypothetical protein